MVYLVPRKIIVGIALLLMVSLVSYAQQKNTSSFIKIEKLTGMAKRDLIDTPEFRSNYARSPGQSKKWAKFRTEYQISPRAPEWIDGLTFQYHVMSLKVGKDKKRKYTLFKKVVRYADIENPIGKRITRRSVVYLRPTALRRYGDLQAVAVEVLYDGKVLASYTDRSKSSKLPAGEWWKNRAILDSDMVTTLEGYLLNKDESPFALVNMDDYELIR